MSLADVVVGVGGREGAFSMCTFWLVEALTRVWLTSSRPLREVTAHEVRPYLGRGIRHKVPRQSHQPVREHALVFQSSVHVLGRDR